MKTIDKKEEDIILEVDGKKYTLTTQELALSNSMLLEALIAELTKKGIIDPESLGETIQEVQSARIRKK